MGCAVSGKLARPGGYQPVLRGAVMLRDKVPVVNFAQQRCNPYGHATDAGPKHLMGGLYGPQYEGRYKWACENRVNVRARMACQFGHRGQEMYLCRPHAIEIQKRQSGLCTRCAWPPEAIAVNEQIERWRMELSIEAAAGNWNGATAARLRQSINDGGHRMTELYQMGIIKKEPLTLTEVS